MNDKQKLLVMVGTGSFLVFLITIFVEVLEDSFGYQGDRLGI